MSGCYLGRVGLIKNAVAQHYGLAASELVSDDRSRRVAHPRQVAMFLARETTDLSLPNIARRFGRKDHTTVLHAVRAVEQRMRDSEAYACEVVAVRQIVAWHTPLPGRAFSA